MSQPVARIFERNWTRLGAAALTVAVGSIVPLSGLSLGIVAAVAGVLGYAVFAAACIREPLIFVMVFLLVLEVLPPFYFSQLDDRPVYVSFFLLPIALAIVITRFPDIRFLWDPVAKGLAFFLAGTALSLPFAWWLSGAAVGKESLSRWFLLSQMALVYYLIRGGARAEGTRTERRMFQMLLIGAVLSERGPAPGTRSVLRIVELR